MAKKKTEEELVTFVLRRDDEEEGTTVTVPLSQAEGLGYVAPKTTTKAKTTGATKPKASG